LNYRDLAEEADALDHLPKGFAGHGKAKLRARHGTLS